MCIKILKDLFEKLFSEPEPIIVVPTYVKKVTIIPEIASEGFEYYEFPKFSYPVVESQVLYMDIGRQTDDLGGIPYYTSALATYQWYVNGILELLEDQVQGSWLHVENTTETTEISVKISDVKILEIVEPIYVEWLGSISSKETIMYSKPTFLSEEITTLPHDSKMFVKNKQDGDIKLSSPVWFKCKVTESSNYEAIDKEGWVHSSSIIGDNPN
jgi:hypothetical protein